MKISLFSRWFGFSLLAVATSASAVNFMSKPYPEMVRETHDGNWADWEKIRVEGNDGSTLLRKPKNFVNYIRKYRSGVVRATNEQLSYFNDQRELYRALKTEAKAVPNGAIQAHLAFVGDVMWLRTDWGTFLDSDLKKDLEKFDGMVGNLETPISKSQGLPAWWLPDAFNFNARPELVTSFRRANGVNLFKALSFANNHSFDMKDQGAKETIKFLNKEKISHSGVRLGKNDRTWSEFQVNGLRFGFYAATWGYNDPRYVSKYLLSTVPGLAPEPDSVEAVDLKEIREALKEMDAAGIDFKLVSLHWGHEYEIYPTPVTMMVGRRIAEAGADIVIGSHPHVIQPSEICFFNGAETKEASIKNLPGILPGHGCALKSADGRVRKSMIYYSLGDFATDMITYATRIGALQSLKFFKNGTERDWTAPDFQLVYNKTASLDQSDKRLLDLNRFIKANCWEKKCPPRLEKRAAFFKSHLDSRMSQADLELERKVSNSFGENWNKGKFEPVEQ